MNRILIIDWGSQLTQLIARIFREKSIYSETYNIDDIINDDDLDLSLYSGIVLSGSPASVSSDDRKYERIHNLLLSTQTPKLGICYGALLLCKLYGGVIDNESVNREFGAVELHIENDCPLFDYIHWKIGGTRNVWMSHFSKISDIPANFKPIAHTTNSSYALFANSTEKVYCLLFHPEASHSEYGHLLLENFARKICNIDTSHYQNSDHTFNKNFITLEIERIRRLTNDSGNIVAAISGGVDSAVAAKIVHSAVGERLHCIFVDHGLLRHNEVTEVSRIIKENIDGNLRIIDAHSLFLNNLKGVIDPEAKRKIIGKTFIEVFEKEAKQIGDVNYLVQGTLYPDVVESADLANNKVDTIKSHHNVGGLPKNMRLQLIEPLRLLFKDEVRKLGASLNMTHELLNRQPFPGPGLAIRIIGEVLPEKVTALQHIDHIFIDELKKYNLHEKTWQAFAVLLPVKSVGVMGDQRTYGNVCVLRAVTSRDAMTADVALLDIEILGKIATRIVNETKHVTRVCYDLSSKPPATIEWE